jgi:hypothetical protein
MSKLNQDHDLSKLLVAIHKGPHNNLMKTTIVEKAYFDEWKKDILLAVEARWHHLVL